MKVPYHRKREVGSSQPLMTPSDYAYGGSSAINPDPRIFSDAPNQSVNYDWMVDPTEANGENRRKGVGRLVRKLNCGASRRDIERDNYVHHIQQQQHQDFGGTRSSWGWTPPVQMDTDITRQVLITVNDGEHSPHSGHGLPDNHTSTNSFVVGASPGRSKSITNRFGFGNLRSKSMTTRTPPRVSFHSTSKSEVQTRTPSRETDDVLTSQERARRQRWRKGIERSWKDDADVPFTVSGDESTYGCSVFTGSGTSAESDTDYTTASSDESAGYSSRYGKSSSSYRHNQRRQPGSRGHRHQSQQLGLGQVRTSPPRNSRSSRNRQIQYRSNTDESMWAGVAEDVGILAGMILADGTACVGSVAAITHETVAEGCAPQHI